ncbi:unnamed protein product [Cladocopium goreaui]|uniref:Copia protein n=1 Tax=Cladocopium goreaui TaxID=2562237 RepID=A0A9P1FX31_9DINO|nr:unnamed protein product [Cladocopium goreaui]
MLATYDQGNRNSKAADPHSKEAKASAGDSSAAFTEKSLEFLALMMESMKEMQKRMNDSKDEAGLVKGVETIRTGSPDLPVLAPWEAQQGPLILGDWLLLAKPIIADLSLTAGEWWRSTVKSAEESYKLHMSLSPLERIKHPCQAPPEITMEKWQRVERRARNRAKEIGAVPPDPALQRKGLLKMSKKQLESHRELQFRVSLVRSGLGVDTTPNDVNVEQFAYHLLAEFEQLALTEKKPGTSSAAAKGEQPKLKSLEAEKSKAKKGEEETGRYNNYPAGLGKGFDSGVVGAWLDEELAQMLPASFDLRFQEVAEVLIWTSHACSRYWRTIYASGLWLNRNTARQIDGYSTLASLTAKMGYRLYQIRPKLHMMCHIQLDLQTSLANPRSAYVMNPAAHMTWADEDFIGRIKSD